MPGLLGGPAGDALITVEFVPHPLFRVEGDTLRRDLVDHARRGGARRQGARRRRSRGRSRSTCPPESSGGRTLRLKGKGLPRSAGGRGDLLVTLRIVLPEKADPDLDALMERWRESKRYAVRDSEDEVA